MPHVRVAVAPVSFIFLSHSSRDDAAADALREWLAQEGHAAVFLDHDGRGGIAGGEPWEERLYTELRRCRALIVLVSPDWLASPWCVAEADHAQALRKPVLPLRIASIDPAEYQRRAPPVLRRVQGIEWDGGEEARSRLRCSLLAAGLDPKDLFAWRSDRAPYPGLAAFEREDAAVYFGREQEVTDLLALLRECRAPRRPRLALVQGASGTGKSSLLRAGVLPRLERDPGNWLVVPPFRPLRDPLQGLVEAITAAAGGGPEEPAPASGAPSPGDQVGRAEWFAAWARWIAGAAARMRRRAGSADATVLLSVDQLEEALAGPGDGAGDTFLQVLREVLAAADHRLLAVATLRADFTGTLQRHPALREPAAAGGEILATRAFQLGPLQRATFHTIIEGPAALASLVFEPGLTSRLVEEARTDDALPLLAFVLRELWEHRDKRDLSLTHAEYDSFGGLEAAVGLRAGQIVAGIAPTTAELEAFRATLIFRMAELSAEGRILRRRLPLAEVPETARRLVEEFARAHLLVADGDTVEVAHEALFRRWEPLRVWLEAANEDLGIRRRAREAAEHWEHARRPRGSLWRPPDLDFLRRHAASNPGTLDAVQSAFLAASERQAAREGMLRRAVVAAIAIFALAAAGLGTLSWFNAQEAGRERERAEQQAHDAMMARTEAEAQREQANVRLAEARLAQAQTFASVGAQATERGDSMTGMLLALHSYARARETMGGTASPEAKSALYRSWLMNRETTVLSGQFAAFSPDGKRLATVADDGTARVWDLRGARTEATVLGGHRGTVRDATFSPDGQRLAIASWDNFEIWLWDLRGARPETTVLEGHRGAVLDAAFSPDGQRLATASDDGTARVWDLRGARPEAMVLEGHRDLVRRVAFSPDGQQLATASRDGTARVWDLRGARPEATVLEGHRGPVWHAAFSPDGRRLATAFDDGTARVWDLSGERPEGAVLGGHRDLVRHVAFSPDGGRLATASDDGTARVWDLSGGRPEPTVLEGHRAVVWRAVFSPDGGRLATASQDGTARVWDLSGGRPEATVLGGHQAEVRQAAFSPDGRRLSTASADGTARVWDLRGERPQTTVLKGHRGAVWRAAFSPDGKRLATASQDGTARVWDLSGGQPEPTVLEGHGGPVLDAAFSPDGGRLATASADFTARVWDLSGGRPQPIALEGHRDLVRSVAFSPDGGRLATASDDSTARVWDLRGVRPEATVLEGHRGPVRHVAFSPDGGRLATASADFTARLWDLSGGRPQAAVLGGHRDLVRRVAFSPDGQRLATASDDFTARVWDLRGARPEATVLQGHRGEVRQAAFSPDGQRLATVADDGTARVWDLSGGRPEATVLGGYRGAVWRAAFSPDGQRLATPSDDTTARVWDLSDGRPEATVLEGHRGSVRDVAFSPDGQRLATASDDGTARVWTILQSDGALVAAACQALARGLTISQRELFGLPQSARLSEAERQRVPMVHDEAGRFLPSDPEISKLCESNHGVR
ncbi:TIR domain-containing protein [Roseomonas sp. GCM10028921]